MHVTFFLIFRVSKKAITWNSALTTCKAIGGKLYEPSNLQENDLTADHASAFMQSWCWIGITDSETEGKWLLESSKTTIPFENWYPGQPNGGESQNCVQMYASSSSANHGKWSDDSCSCTWWCNQ